VQLSFYDIDVKPGALRKALEKYTKKGKKYRQAHIGKISRRTRYFSPTRPISTLPLFELAGFYRRELDTDRRIFKKEKLLRASNSILLTRTRIYKSPEEFKERVREWEAIEYHEVESILKGNAMT
ncbi:hypothetical protein LARI1_G005241, partial [Lachnellula arida]